MTEQQEAKEPVSEGGGLQIRRVGLLAGALLLVIRLYQRLIAPLWPVLFGPNAGCRFYPSCSHYTAEALRVHGAFRGTALGAWRILRCTPLSKGGLDPVPPRHRAAPSCVRR